jgi:hypothetical protein
MAGKADPWADIDFEEIQVCRDPFISGGEISMEYKPVPDLSKCSL